MAQEYEKKGGEVIRTEPWKREKGVKKTDVERTKLSRRGKRGGG